MTENNIDLELLDLVVKKYQLVRERYDLVINYDNDNDQVIILCKDSELVACNSVEELDKFLWGIFQCTNILISRALIKEVT